MPIRKIATKNVVTLTPEATVQDAAKKMREYHVGNVVIVESKNGKTVPLGILTDRDIVLSLVAFGLDASKVLAEEIMAPLLTTAKSTDSFNHVLELMKQHGVKRIPLVNSAGALEGIVSDEDIISILAFELTNVARIKDRQIKVESDRRRKFA